MKNQLSILHIMTVDNGGAYKAAARMQQALLRYGVKSKILLRNKENKDLPYEEYLNNPLKKLVSKSKNVLNMFFASGEINRDLLGSDISGNKAVLEADILVLHWFNSFLSYRSLEKLFSLKKPIVFVMHDMWLFTGGCHVDRFCGGYEKGCGNCPLIGKVKETDVSRKNFMDKQKLFEQADFQVLGPSRWIVECAEKSEILKDKKITCIPNCYNETIFYPRENTEELKRKYGVPSDRKIILFGAAFHGTANQDKGFSYLLEALDQLSPEKYFLLVFGNAQKEDMKGIRQQYCLTGYIEKEEQLAELYSIADVYVTPSLQESFGFTVCESMACATPVTAFPVGGILDQITHQENGYVAQLKDAGDIARGIIFCAENKDALGKKAALSAQRFSYDTVGKMYRDYFEHVFW